ncbi:MAG: CPBP family intramembrane metalloprotease [Candidatus Mariimomonas ferrooxydans]
MEFLRIKILAIALLIESIALISAFLLARYFDISLFPLTANFFRDILIGTLAAFPPFALFVFSLSEKAEKFPVIGSLKKIMITDIRAIFSNAHFFDLFLISLLAGFAEEILFRGIIQYKFGIIIASILFGLVHFLTPAYALIAVIMGFYIGIFFHVFESLLIPIHLHFIYDLGALIYLKYFVTSEPGCDART